MERTSVIIIDTLSLCAETISMSCNDQKTVCMIVNPRNRSRSVRSSFSLFKLGTSYLQFVSSFRYLGHILSDTLCDNDIFIERLRTSLYVQMF